MLFRTVFPILPRKRTEKNDKKYNIKVQRIPFMSGKKRFKSAIAAFLKQIQPSFIIYVFDD